ncbi:leucine zipper-like transcriptional regulator, putative [Eimeria mitis]|uniref:Leucine zipper-like transcriptional regulator, putative n=1 Tax=Eimeria mitis TaxID=44415 RepID=U6K0I0_9EIME|nr:leucine zipper-like transcriptional regulator, putative [Eimeria mitis]CDJ30476.1 leucine zipper-like transcriptional regulator, putative [Eimeria mitis]
MHEQGLFLFGGYNGVERLSDLFSRCSSGAAAAAAAAAATVAAATAVVAAVLYHTPPTAAAAALPLPPAAAAAAAAAADAAAAANITGDLLLDTFMLHAPKTESCLLLGGIQGERETYEWRFIDGGRLLPSGRSSMVGVIFKNNFVVFGGYDGHPLSPPPSTLLTNLLSLQAPTPLSDAVFIVEGRIMHSSRALLACRSEHFRALFFGGLKEANDRENKPIPIEGIRHEVRV